MTRSQDGGVSANGFAAQGTLDTKLLWRLGWAAGAGIEIPVAGGWTAKAEYLYMDLGSLATSVDFSQPGNPGTVVTNSTIRDHIVRIGANYRLN